MSSISTESHNTKKLSAALTLFIHCLKALATVWKPCACHRRSLLDSFKGTSAPQPICPEFRMDAYLMWGPLHFRDKSVSGKNRPENAVSVASPPPPSPTSEKESTGELGAHGCHGSVCTFPNKWSTLPIRQILQRPKRPSGSIQEVGVHKTLTEPQSQDWDSAVTRLCFHLPIISTAGRLKGSEDSLSTKCATIPKWRARRSLQSLASGRQSTACILSQNGGRGAFLPR